MRKFPWFWTILILLQVLPLQAQILRLSRIKLAVDGIHYTWEENSPIPALGPGGLSHPATIFSFLDLQPGQTLSARDMERRVERGRIRLEESNYFYLVDLNLIPSRSQEGDVTLVIRLTEGFRQRYNGGPFWAYWGLDNLQGRGDELGIWAGWNRNQLEYLRHFTPGGPMSMAVKGGYESSTVLEPLAFNLVNTEFRLEYDCSPGSSIVLMYGVYLPLKTSIFVEYQNRVSINLSNSWIFPGESPSSLGYSLCLSQSMDRENRRSGRLEMRGLFPLGPSIGQIKAQAMISDPSLDPYFELPLVQGYLRASHGEGDPIGSHHFMGYSLEYPVAVELENFSLYPYVYWDQILLNYQEGLEALGMGIHLFFPGPVFLDINAWGGLNMHGEGLFHIDVSLGHPYPLSYDFRR